MWTELSPTEWRSPTTGLTPSKLDWIRYRSGQITLLAMVVIWIVFHARGELDLPVRLIITGLTTFTVALRISPSGGVRIFRKGEHKFWSDGISSHERSWWRGFGFGMYGARGERPDSQLGSRAVRTCGELLVVFGWILFVATSGVVTFLVTGQRDDEASGAFHLLAAGSVLAGAVLLLICDVGFHLAGFVALPRTAKGWVNRLLATVIATVSAGYDDVLEHVGWLAFTWVPVHVWNAMSGWHLIWLAVLISIPLGAIWLLVYLLVVRIVRTLARGLLGPENAVNETLEDALPVGTRTP